MFSIYMKKEEGNKSNIIFGGYDLKGIKEGNRDLKNIPTILTVNSSTWAVRMKSLKLGDKYVFDFNYQNKLILFDPSLPYIYLPFDDFMRFE